MTAANTLTRPVPVQWPILSLSLPESSGDMSVPQLPTLLPPEPHVPKLLSPGLGVLQQLPLLLLLSTSCRLDASGIEGGLPP